MDIEGLGQVVLDDAHGTGHRLGALWEDRPVVLVFFRHFGCPFCRLYAVHLRDHYDEILGRGAEVISIGTGNPNDAIAFIEDDRVPYPVLLDEDGLAADAASVRRKNLARLIFSRKAATIWRRERRAGTMPLHKGMHPGKRVTQLGATFVVGPGPVVHYSHLDQHAGDDAPIEAVLAAIPAVGRRDIDAGVQNA